MSFGLEKELLYDWVGGNEAIFKAVNALDGKPTYDSLMVFLSQMANHTNFPYYFIIFLVYACLSFVTRKVTGHVGGKASFVIWMGVLAVFAASYAADGLAVKTIKNYYDYPRPYVALGPQDVHMLEQAKAGDDFHSFPSGHASFITVTVASLWPVLSATGAVAGVALIFAVCWSRMAAGMHFPADVLGGVLISFIVVLIVRLILYPIFAKLFKWKC